MIESWIFDMDGVLINSEPLHYEVDRLILEEAGHGVEDSYLDRFVGMTNEAMWTIIAGDLKFRCPVGDLIDRQIEIKTKLLKERDYRPIEGIPELMEALKGRGAAVGVASSSPRVLIEAVLDKLGLFRYIDSWESAEEVARSKPAPDIYLHVAALLGAVPEKCIAVEDSASGVKAARAAGMRCIAYRNPHSGDQDLSEADLIVKNIGDITC